MSPGARKDPLQKSGMEHSISIRVRYIETDGMGVVHHANYLAYFEEARVEALRRLGASYKVLEEQGFFLVVTRVEVRYRRPAKFDDELVIRLHIDRLTTVRIDHSYQVLRDGTLLVEGRTTLACVDNQGRPRALPDLLRPVSARGHLNDSVGG